MPQGSVSKTTTGPLGVQRTKKNITKESRKGAPKKQKLKSGKAKAQQQLGKQINRNIENIIAAKAIKNGAKLSMIKPEEKPKDTSQQRVKRFKNKIKEEQKAQKKTKQNNSITSTITLSSPSTSTSTSSSSSTSSTTSSTTPSATPTPRKEKSKHPR